jgi:hypothetical protein
MSTFRIVPDPAAQHNIDQATADFFERDLGPIIVGNATRIVPIRTGHLRDSIIQQVEVTDSDGALLEVGVDEDLLGVDYGLYVEKGTSRMHAEPYLVPATLQAGSNFR